MEFGIGSYAMAWHASASGRSTTFTPIDLLREAAGVGATIVQFCENLPVASLPAPDQDRLRDEAESLGIRLEVGMRGLDPMQIRTHVEAAARFGSDSVRVVIDDTGYRPTVSEAIGDLQRLEPLFRSSNVVLAIENHDRFPSRVLVEMIEELGSDWVGICLDTANSIGCLEGPNETVPLLAPYTKCLHVKDVRVDRVPGNMGFRVTGTAAGQGALDIPEILGVVASYRPHASVILETWPEEQPTIDETLALEKRMLTEGSDFLRPLVESSRTRI